MFVWSSYRQMRRDTYGYTQTFLPIPPLPILYAVPTRLRYYIWQTLICGRADPNSHQLWKWPVDVWLADHLSYTCLPQTHVQTRTQTQLQASTHKIRMIHRLPESISGIVGTAWNDWPTDWPVEWPVDLPYDCPFGQLSCFKYTYRNTHLSTGRFPSGVQAIFGPHFMPLIAFTRFYSLSLWTISSFVILIFQ